MTRLPMSLTSALVLSQERHRSMVKRRQSSSKTYSTPQRSVRVCPHLRPAVPIFVWPSPSSSGCPHLRPAVPIFVRLSPSSSDRTTHIVRSVQPDPPDLTSLRLILFMHSHMFSFHNRTSFHVLSSSTFCLRLNPRSSILISVTYPRLSNSGSH